MTLLGVEPGFVVSGFLVGLLVGQTGVGGGSLMTPLLVLLFGVHPVTAVGTDLLYAAATKTVGTAVHGRNQTVDWRIVRLLALGSLPAAALTLFLLWWLQGHGVSGATHRELVSGVLGAVLLLTALSLLMRRQFLALVGPVFDGLAARQIARLTICAGALLGVLVTVSSVGAGAMGVTMLLLLHPRVPMARIVGSDIAHAVPLTLVAGIGHLWMGAVDLLMLVSLLVGSVPGIILGSNLAAVVPESVLRGVLASVLLVVGLRLLV